MNLIQTPNCVFPLAQRVVRRLPEESWKNAGLAQLNQKSMFRVLRNTLKTMGWLSGFLGLFH